ncbi:MAG TPA: DeoR/GlpR family DNA-binding transcription regulator [Nocardioidaceae bacterium]|nr:DeoR/GlpR family DNA-binding transcription regulator [Nocardioidaceae bacterium]
MRQDLRTNTRRRHERLLTLLRAGTTHVEDLAGALGVSVSTVRRDLGRLGEAGAVTRTYGGAVTAGPFRERELSERLRIEQHAKADIGARAAQLVVDGATVFVDAGSTCAQLAEHLRPRSLTVLTRGLEIAIMLASAADVEVVVPGGRVAPKSHGLVGPLTDLTLDRLVVDVAFLGVDAVDPRNGVGEPTLAEAEVKERVAQRARRVVVLADATKLGREAVPAWAPLPPGWTLVTNETRPEVLDAFRAVGVEVLGCD